MSVCGIVAEFNPLHKGHKYLIQEAKKHGDVVTVISGNFVQRGDLAVVEKRKRAKAALLIGADLCLELPVLWSMSTAQNFALGAVSILKNAGCDKIVFGSESGSIEDLKFAADLLSSKEFSKSIEKEIKTGETFAKVRQKIAEKMGVKKDLLSFPNNNLAIEYIIAAKKIGFSCEFITVKRKGAMHDSNDVAEFVSASLLRKKLRANDFSFCEEYIPEEMLHLITENDIADIAKIDKSILAVLRTKTIEDLKKLPDLSEGVENKIFEAISLAKSVDTLYNDIKVKRYTLARIRRLVLSAFLGFDNEFFMKQPPYIRVLGFTKQGEKILRASTKKSEMPIVTTVLQIKKLPLNAQKVFETECKATDLFTLSLPEVLPCGMEYTSKIIKTE